MSRRGGKYFFTHEDGVRMRLYPGRVQKRLLQEKRGKKYISRGFSLTAFLKKFLRSRIPVYHFLLRLRYNIPEIQKKSKEEAHG